MKQQDYICLDGKHLTITGKNIENLYNEPYLQTIECLCVTGIAHEVPVKYSLFKGLKKLAVSSTQTYTLPKDICSLPALEHIVCSGECLLPPETGDMPELKRLDATGDSVLCMPKNIAGAPNLTTLVISYFDTPEPCPMPSWIASLTQLQELHLYQCKFTQIDANIGHLANLRTLSIRGSLSATSAFPLLEGLKKLKRLEITGEGFPGIQNHRTAYLRRC